MEFEEKAGLICVIWEIFLILSASFMPPVWHAFLWLLASGNIFLEIIGVIGIAMALIGFLIILYYVISYIVLALVILFTVLVSMRYRTTATAITNARTME